MLRLFPVSLKGFRLKKIGDKKPYQIIVRTLYSLRKFTDIFGNVVITLKCFGVQSNN